MVLGLFEGSLEVILDKPTASPGEMIKGKVRLKLNNPKKARALRLEFYGEITERRTSHDSKGHMHSHSHTRKIDQTAIQLSSEKTFSNGEEFPFEILCSAGALQGQLEQKGGWAALGAMMQALLPTARYFVHATLDAAMEFDMNKRVQVQVVPKAVPPSTTQQTFASQPLQ